MNKILKRTLIGSSIVVGTVASVCYVSYEITRKLVSIALDRDDEGKIEQTLLKIAKSRKNAELMEAQISAAEKLLEGNFKTVEIKSVDGKKLIAHLHYCKNAKRTVIAMHGWRSSWKRDFGAISGFLHRNRCNVLYVEQRGQNNSEGEHLGFGLKERYDCLSWINFINGYKNLSEKPIYLAGVSMGAATVLMTAGLDLPENVHGIIADCGYTSPDAIWRHVVRKNLHMPYNGIRSAIANDMCRRRIQFASNEYSSVDAMKVCKIPVLFIHGTDDTFVPIKMTYENYTACAAPKYLFVVPGAEHGMSYMVDTEGYEREIKEFWEKYD